MSDGGSPSTPDPAMENLQDHVEALQVLRRVRTGLLLLLLLSMLCPVAVFGLVESGQMAAWSGDENPAASGFTTRDGCEAALRLAEVCAHGSAILLIVVYGVSVNVCLVGRLGSGRDALVALFWMVLLLLIFGAWTADILGLGAPRMFFTMDRLSDVAASSRETWLKQAAYYVTFLGLPVLGAIATVVADMRFGHSYRSAMRRVRDRMGIAV